MSARAGILALLVGGTLLFGAGPSLASEEVMKIISSGCGKTKDSALSEAFREGLNIAGGLLVYTQDKTINHKLAFEETVIRSSNIIEKYNILSQDERNSQSCLSVEMDIRRQGLLPLIPDLEQGGNGGNFQGERLFVASDNIMRQSKQDSAIVEQVLLPHYLESVNTVQKSTMLVNRVEVVDDQTVNLALKIASIVDPAKWIEAVNMPMRRILANAFTPGPAALNQRPRVDDAVVDARGRMHLLYNYAYNPDPDRAALGKLRDDSKGLIGVISARDPANDNIFAYTAPHSYFQYFPEKSLRDKMRDIAFVAILRFSGPDGAALANMPLALYRLDLTCEPGGTLRFEAPFNKLYYTLLDRNIPVDKASLQSIASFDIFLLPYKFDRESNAFKRIYLPGQANLEFPSLYAALEKKYGPQGAPQAVVHGIRDKVAPKFKNGDVIVAVAGTTVATPDDVNQAMARCTRGQEITIDVLRSAQGGPQKISLPYVVSDAYYYP